MRRRPCNAILTLGSLEVETSDQKLASSVEAFSGLGAVVWGSTIRDSLHRTATRSPISETGLVSDSAVSQREGELKRS